MRLTVEEFTKWLANKRPPWAAYRALMGGWMISLDKQPGVHMVGVGDTWLRLMSKCILCVASQEEKAA